MGSQQCLELRKSRNPSFGLGAEGRGRDESRSARKYRQNERFGRGNSELHISNLQMFINYTRTRTRTNTNPNGTEANAAGRSGNARALRKQSKCGMIQEGEGHWPNSSKKMQKARNLWVLRTPQNNKEEGARAKKLATCGTRGPLGRGQSVPFSAQGADCSAPEP
jgi:hypothetical protein